VDRAFAVGSNIELQQNVKSAMTIGDGLIVGTGSTYATILNTKDATIANENNYGFIVGGTGSAIFGGDYVGILNGNRTIARDSDFTTIINGHPQDVVLNGNGHVVMNLERAGAGIDLLEYRENSNYLGDTYMGGAIFNEFKQLECGDGVTITLSDTQYQHDNTFVFNWSGLSPGTTTVELPNAVNNDYKKVNYKFITNQTFDGTTKLNIVGFNNQLIDGQPYYDVFQPYNTFSLFASGSGWLTYAGDAQRFGDFYDTTDQTANLANTAYSMSLNSVGIVDGVKIETGSRIYADRLGIYNLQFSAQLQKNTGGDVEVYIWLAKNGTNVPNSNTNVTIAGGSGARAVAAWNFLTQYDALTDFYELRWGADTAGTTIEYTASPPIGPAIPSIILTLTQVG
jgi:hypothetical protein